MHPAPAPGSRPTGGPAPPARPFPDFPAPVRPAGGKPKAGGHDSDGVGPCPGPDAAHTIRRTNRNGTMRRLLTAVGACSAAWALAAPPEPPPTVEQLVA